MSREAHAVIRDNAGDPAIEVWAQDGLVHLVVAPGGAALGAVQRLKFSQAYAAASAVADRQEARASVRGDA